jgi:hypothetical protein
LGCRPPRYRRSRAPEAGVSLLLDALLAPDPAVVGMLFAHLDTVSSDCVMSRSKDYDRYLRQERGQNTCRRDTFRSAPAPPVSNEVSRERGSEAPAGGSSVVPRIKTCYLLFHLAPL